MESFIHDYYLSASMVQISNYLVASSICHEIDYRMYHDDGMLILHKETPKALHDTLRELPYEVSLSCFSIRPGAMTGRGVLKFDVCIHSVSDLMLVLAGSFLIQPQC
jgi:hypothetical protein